MEQDRPEPLSIYGKSKLAGEGWVVGMGDKGLIIRTAWLYGKNGKNYIDTILNKLELGIDVSITNDQVGCPTYTIDLANAVIKLATNYKSGIFNVVNSGYCTWYNFAVHAAKLMNYDVKHLKIITTEDLQRKAKRPKYCVLSLNRLERTLPDKMRHWKDALNQYLIETEKLHA